MVLIFSNVYKHSFEAEKQKHRKQQQTNTIYASP